MPIRRSRRESPPDPGPESTRSPSATGYYIGLAPRNQRYPRRRSPRPGTPSPRSGRRNRFLGRSAGFSRAIDRRGRIKKGPRQPPASVELLSPLAAHADPEVRESVVHGLLPVARLAIPELVQLSADEDENVRNWATFGLNAQLGGPGDKGFVDSDAVRDALAARLDDPHEETRAEAVEGLARRRDPRALPVLQRELEQGPEWQHYIEAAELFADPSLHPALVRISEMEEPPFDVSAAMEACRPGRG